MLIQQVTYNLIDTDVDFSATIYGDMNVRQFRQWLRDTCDTYHKTTSISACRDCVILLQSTVTDGTLSHKYSRAVCLCNYNMPDDIHRILSAQLRRWKKHYIKHNNNI